MVSSSLINDIDDRVLSHEDLLAHHPGPTEWTVEDFIERGAYAVLAAEPKAGKSALATHLAYAVALGQPFLGKATTQAAVLWLAYEESTRERRMLMERYPDAPVFVKFDARPMDSEEGIAQIGRLVKHLRPGLVVIDPLMAAVQADSMSEARKARVAMTGINAIRRAYDTSFLVLHHLKKGHGRRGDHNRLADSHQIFAAAGQSWIMEVKEGDTRLIELHGKGRGEHANGVVSIESSDPWNFREIGKGTWARGRSAKANKGEQDSKERFVAALVDKPEGLTVRRVAEASGLDHDYAKNLATKLIQSKQIILMSKAGKANVYALAK